MGVRLSEDEAWRELEAAHTGILTTLRRDGWPVSLPVWFAAVDRRIYVRTPAKTKKVARVRHDPRGTFLVERGEKWIDLCAVMVTGPIDVVEDDDEYRAALAAIDRKYEGYGMAQEKVPDATRDHYRGRSALLRLSPEGRLITWDNSRLRLDAGEGR